MGIGAKSANAFLLPRFRCTENRPKTVKNAWGYLYLPVLLRGHTAAYGGKHGASAANAEVLVFPIAICHILCYNALKLNNGAA